MKALLSPILFSLVAIQFLHGKDWNQENPDDPSKYSYERKLVFFAVLEGLYEEGVAGEALELILPDPGHMLDPAAPEKANFVYACPICMATFDALVLYAARRPFFAQKGTRYNTYGVGLPKETMERLRGKPQERRLAIEGLVEKWIKKRLANQNLTKEQRATVEKNLVSMRKDGEKMLKTFQGEWAGKAHPYKKYYTGWKGCSACNGATPWYSGASVF